MTTTYTESDQARDLELSAQADLVEFRFQPTRREFVQVLGAGIVIAVCTTALGQAPAGGGGRGSGRGGGGGINGQTPANLAARLHIGKDGMITVLCGKVECGQGLRAEVTQAAAEELRVPVDRVLVILADTDLTPNDGATVGSGSTPRTIPPIRQAAAAARDLLANFVATQWKVAIGEVDVRDGKVTHAASKREMTFAEIAGAQNLEQALQQAPGNRNATVTVVQQWKIMGTPVLRPNAKDIVMGRHMFPSDVQRPGMLYGKVLRAPGYNTKPTNIDVADAKAMKDVTIIQDGAFVGVAAPSTFAAKKAIEAIALSSKWESTPHPNSAELADFLVKNANVPANRFTAGANEKTFKASYFIPYVQHAPMEPRAAVAEWSANNTKLTVWTASQNPSAVQTELVNAFRLTAANVRVIINDFGGGFGGKHTGESAVEAARLAKGAGKPVSLRWTREEEFTWAYFRPAGVMQAEATLDAAGKITSWYFININSGPSAVQTPYAITNNLCQTVNSQPPLRHGSYRGLAATANVFARECFMDELADAAGKDPLEFRLAHLQDARLRNVLQSVATRFDWAARSKKKDVCVGIACATEKGSYVATAAEIVLDRAKNSYTIQHIAEVFECGAIVNPSYLMSQVQGSIIQGLGPLLREEMIFQDGRMRNAAFADYAVPRFADVPSLDVHLLNRTDLASAGAGETPIVTVAPAIANAVSRAIGKRVREMPIRIA